VNTILNTGVLMSDTTVVQVNISQMCQSLLEYNCSNSILS